VPDRPIGVVHLVRHVNGIEPFRRFLASYREYDPGCAAELVLVAKGFPGSMLPDPYAQLAQDVVTTIVHVSDDGVDITAFGLAAAQLDYDVICLVNSFSRGRCAGWLALLAAPVLADRADLAGASGTYESTSTTAWRQTRADMAARPAWRAGVTLAARLPNHVRLWASFPAFPNPHLRTNGLVLRRAPLAAGRASRVRTKWQALRFESGWRGLTRRALTDDRAVVVGRDGAVSPPDAWPSTSTYRSGEQENLLLADNRTDDYDAADPETRRHLRQLTWGVDGGCSGPVGR
jgi:hypothetical protein